MSVKRCLLSWLVAFVAIQAISFVIHAVLLRPHYAGFPNLLRTQEEAAGYLSVMLLAHAIFALAAVWIYQQGAQAKPWPGQGVRFGIALWMVASVPNFLIAYAVSPWSQAVVLRQIGYELLGLIVLGLIIAALHGSKK